MSLKKKVTWEYDDFDFDVEPLEDSIEVIELESGFLVGCLVHDDDPLEWNWGDATGDIYIGNRHYTTCDKYFEALGLDRYGERDEEMEPNPDAVLLSVYDHSGITLSILGEGIQCQWDTANGGAVWVPDKYLIEEVESMSAENRRQRMVDYARQALGIYNAYEHGDIWGICIREYDVDKTFFKGHEMCWGYVGYEYAIEELKSTLTWLSERESESRLEVA